MGSFPVANEIIYDRKFQDFQLEDGVVEAVEFYDCIFQRCSFQEAGFERCKFHDCTFKECNLPLVRFENCTFTNAKFEDCHIVGINWSKADLQKKPLQKPFYFKNCALDYSVFLGVSLQGVSIIDCTAREVDFSDADLTRCDCSGSDFTGSRFVNTILTEADFSSAKNYTINATLNKLKSTRFSLPEAVSLLRSLDIELEE